MKYISRDELVSTGKCKLVVNFEVDGNTNDLEKGAKDEFLPLLVNRGGLIKPSDLLFVTCVHAAAFFKYIKSKEYISNMINGSNPRSVFSSLVMKKIEDNDETAALLNNECNQPFRLLIPQIAMKIFYIMAKNFINERNDNIHKERKREVNSKLNKRDKYMMKQQKLSSKK